jgi:hypothetical protein
METERSFDAIDSKTGNYFYILKAVSYKKCWNYHGDAGTHYIAIYNYHGDTGHII